jgi:hypothetical protein
MDLTGETYRSISQDYPYSKDALRRHKTNHIAAIVGDIKAIMEQARIEVLEEARQQEMEDLREEVISAAKDSMAARLENAAGFIDQLREVRDKAAGLLDQAEASQDMRAAGTFLRELREQIRLMAELEGRIASQPQITLISSPEWVEVRSLVINALEPYPEAREAVVRAIRGR